MRRCVCSLLIVGVGWLGGCEPDGRRGSETTERSPESSESQKVAPSAEGGSEERATRETARPPAAWVEERVSEARERLRGSRPGSVLWTSIEAHGGLESWYRNGPLHFRYDYRPRGDRPDHDTVQTVDTWSARARHRVTDHPDHLYGWNGEKGWFKPTDWDRPYDVRFWALTPYYFVGMPFVLADPGVNLEYEGTESMAGTSCHVIRATFGDVGISPDDYYVLYVAEEDHRLEALRYIVSYDPFFDEREHSPEKLMTYEGEQTVDGIEFAETYRFFMWSPEQKTEADVVTVADLSQVDFRPDLEDGYFDVPEGAAIHPEDRN